MASKTISTRLARVEDAEDIHRLILSLTPFFSFETSSEEATLFWEAMSLEATTKRLQDPSFRYRIALDDGRVVGVVAIRDTTHLFHLFVDAQCHRRGIGKELWRLALRDAVVDGNPGGRFTVNSSPYAVGVYEKFGFRATADPVAKDGIISVPMQLVSDSV